MQEDEELSSTTDMSVVLTADDMMLILALFARDPAPGDVAFLKNVRVDDAYSVDLKVVKESKTFIQYDLLHENVVVATEKESVVPADIELYHENTVVILHILAPQT